MERTSRDSSGATFVVKRGQVFTPVTSGVEQSFSASAERLGSSRLNASAAVEDHCVPDLSDKSEAKGTAHVAPAYEYELSRDGREGVRDFKKHKTITT